MFTMTERLQPATLEEAYQTLIAKRSNTLLGGCAYLKMGAKRIGVGIDLSKLDLQYIREKGDYIEIGAMTTFRDIETSEILQRSFGGALSASVRNIVGVQFRNGVTIGASVFSRYGFSDPLTALLALDAEVQLYEGGRMSLEAFLRTKRQKDILTAIWVPRKGQNGSYQDLRNSMGDYPILNVSVAKAGNTWRIAVGARPMKAAIAQQASQYLTDREEITEETVNAAAEQAACELMFGTNMRGSGAYRRNVCKALVKRGVMEVLGWR